MILHGLIVIMGLSIPDEHHDHELSERIREGDKEAFRTFFEKYQSPLLSWLLSKGMERANAEDLLQQAFLAIWEKRDGLKPDLSLRSFLFRIAYNGMLNFIRDNRRISLRFAFEMTGDGPHPGRETESAEIMMAIQSALEGMPEKRRLVFELCYLQEFSYKEAAEVMKVSRKTVENHMALALKDLRRSLNEFYEDTIGGNPPGFV